MLVALDFETRPIGPNAEGDVICAPKAICASMAWTKTFHDPDPQCEVETQLFAGPELHDAIEAILQDDDIEIVIHNASFDLCVICESFPDLIPLVIAKIDASKVYCTRIREKILNIATHGRVDTLLLPDGSKDRILYDLNALGKKYLGTDRSAEKDSLDSWRTNYDRLEGLTAAEYPPEARDYAIQDAIDALLIYEAQEEAARDLIVPGFPTESLNVAADFALKRMSCRGIAIDQERRAEVAAKVAEDLTPEKLAPLYQAGILNPEEPPRPHKTNPGRMTKGKPASVNTKALRALVEAVAAKVGYELKTTDSGLTSTDVEVLEELRTHDEILEAYAQRQHAQKLVTTYLPALEGAKRVHAGYDCVKETFRTSSSADKLYKFSLNVQNQDPRIRPCFVPSDGMLFASIDYSGIELACLGQKIKTIFGSSTLLDQINQGVDPHAYLGSVLAYYLDERFRTACDANGADREATYRAFLAFKKDERPEGRTFFKHYRTLAKPTGLGYPGGLGPETFVAYAKAVYGITVDLQTATVLRDLWHQAYPEMRGYFDWISRSCVDPRNAGSYSYLSPCGAYRAGASYCAAANGAALQTPAAEGAKIALWNLERAAALCATKDRRDVDLSSAARPLAFIHDEVLFEVPADLEGANDAVIDATEIMVDSMRMVLPDVQVKCEAKLMERWYKEAEPIYENGLLQVWRPEEEAVSV